jgi:DNA-binding NarL/FixJ family response regulator
MSILASDLATKLQPASGYTFALVDDDNATREYWIKLLESFHNFKCVTACSTGEDALRTIPAAKPSVILMDIFMPGISGIECTAQLKIVLPHTQILIFTASDDPELVFPALEAGADGYLIKQAQPAEVHKALLGVLNGDVPMTSGIARRVAEYFRKKSDLPHQSMHLSNREGEILIMLSKGYSNKEIAAELKLSIATIHSYLKNVYDKMHVHSRTQAMAKYINFHKHPVKS